MSTFIGLNDQKKAATWSNKLFYESIRAAKLFPFMVGLDREGNVKTEDDAGHLIALYEDLERGTTKGNGGDVITTHLVGQLSGDGRTSGEGKEGFGEDVNIWYDRVFINQIMHLTDTECVMTKQRLAVDVQGASHGLLKDWHTRRLDMIGFAHLTGNTLVTKGVLNGHNTITAPTVGRHFAVGETPSLTAVPSEGSLGTSDYLQLDHLPVMYEKMIEANIRPVKTEAGDKYIMFISDGQATQLRTDADWKNVQLYTAAGGKISENPMFGRSLGEYANIILHQTPYLSRGIATGAYIADSRRAVCCGAQALQVAYGNASKNKKGGSDVAEKMRWTEVEQEHGDRVEIGASCVMGVKKTVFKDTDDDGNSVGSGIDFGCIVLSTYDASAGTAFAAAA